MKFTRNAGRFEWALQFDWRQLRIVSRRWVSEYGTGYLSFLDRRMLVIHRVGYIAWNVRK